LVLAAGASWLAWSHGKAAEEATTLAKLAKTAAETAKNEVADLTTKLGEQGSKIDIQDKVDAGVKAFENAINGRLDEFQTALSGTVTKKELLEITEDIHQCGNLNTDALRAVQERMNKIGELVEIIHNKTNQQDQQLNILNKQLDYSDTIEEIQQLLPDNTTTLSGTVTNHVNETLPTIGQATQIVQHQFNNSEVAQLFEIPKDGKPTKEFILALNDEIHGTTEQRKNYNPLSFINMAFVLNEPTNPSNIKQLYENIHLLKNNALNYKDEISNADATLRAICNLYTGEIQNKDALLTVLKETTKLSKAVIEDLAVKADAVLTAGKAENATLTTVENAQETLITALKILFTKSKTDLFNEGYPNAITKVAPNTNHDWATPFFSPHKSLEEMTEVIVQGGLNGTHNNNTHTDPHTLATIVLPNLIEKIGQTYPDNIKVTLNQGSIFVNNEEGVGEPLRNLVSTLDEFRQALRPINPEKQYYDEIFYTRTPDEITALKTVEEQLQAKMINARLQGDTAEMGNITTEMYDHLRAKLKAFKEEPLAGVSSILNIEGLTE
jgi:hypothetical protein